MMSQIPFAGRRGYEMTIYQKGGKGQTANSDTGKIIFYYQNAVLPELVRQASHKNKPLVDEKPKMLNTKA